MTKLELKKSLMNFLDIENQNFKKLPRNSKKLVMEKSHKGLRDQDRKRSTQEKHDPKILGLRLAHGWSERAKRKNAASAEGSLQNNLHEKVMNIEDTK
uniref:Uncharacterized protein n=1 Tax=Romanomermis culicivorax TaxID=13658 RepID=A0A915KZZ4_ROMCU